MTGTNFLKNDCDFRNSILDCFIKPKQSDFGLQIDGFLFKKWRQKNDILFKKNIRLYGTNPVEHIMGVFLSNKYRKSSAMKVADSDFRNDLRKKITKIVKTNKPIILVLPSFPFKSGNFAKCQRRLPDLAEIASLSRLWEITELIKYGYRPGIKIVILSDGLMLSRAFNINPYFSKIYFQTIKQWIKKLGMGHRIKIIDLDSAVRNNFPMFDRYVRKEIKKLKKTLKAEDIGSLYYSLRLNYDNTLWLKKFTAMSLSEFTADVAEEFLKEHDADIKDSIYEYKALWNIIEKLNAIDSIFPNHIRATPHAFKHDHKLTFHMVNEHTLILPWMGVGTIRKRGSISKGIISVGYEYNINHKQTLPIFWKTQETPFGNIII